VLIAYKAQSLTFDAIQKSKSSMNNWRFLKREANNFEYSSASHNCKCFI